MHEIEHLKSILCDNNYKLNVQNSGQTEGELESIEFRSSALHPECPLSYIQGVSAKKILCLLQAGYKNLPCTFQHLKITACIS